MTHDTLIKKSRVGRGTFYRLLAGKGEEVDQATLDKLGTVLQVEAPTIRRVLERDRPEEREPGPLELVREAQAILRRAEIRLNPTAPAADAERLTPAERRHLETLRQDLTASQRPQQNQKRSNRG